MAVAFLFITATIAVNVLSKSLHYFHGKCEFMVLLGLFFVHMTYPIKDHELMEGFHGQLAVVLGLSLFLTLFWTNILIYDVFWTFR